MSDGGRTGNREEGRKRGSGGGTWGLWSLPRGQSRGLHQPTNSAEDPEIVRGYHKKQATRQLENFLTVIASEEVIPLDQPAAELAGRIAGELERIGQPIGTSDPMIAATALHHGIELVTANTAHFQRIQQLGYPLNLANWRT